MGRWWGDALLESDPFSVIDDRLRPLTEEQVMRKTRYSAFKGTDLEAFLLRSTLKEWSLSVS